MAKYYFIFFVFVIGILFIFLPAIECSTLVSNNNREIEGCDNLLKLKLIRKMDDEDLNKVFKMITDILIDERDNLYVCDQALHQVRVFDSNWEYTKTIGKRGKGPGDVLGPNCLGFSPGLGLAVLEFNGMRIQSFDTKGHSQGFVKLKGLVNWMEITSTNDFVLYDSLRTFKTRKLLYVIDKKGNLLREIGNFHNTSERYLDSEGFCIGMDDSGNLYVANRHAPVIRKYSLEGELLQCITFEMPIKIPDVRVEVIAGGKDVKIHNEAQPPKRGRDGKGSKRSDKQWISCIQNIIVDPNQLIFIVSAYRRLSEEESKKTTIRGMSVGGIMSVERPTLDIDEYPEFMRMMVFGENGKIIATAPLRLPFSSPRVKGNRLYVVDNVLEPGVWEYEFSICEKGK